MIRILIAALLLTGCSGDSVPIAVFDESYRATDPGRDELPEVVADACDVLGIACHAADFKDLGVVTVALVPDSTELQQKGRVLASFACRQIVWSVDDPFVLAHELGHVFGLDHVADHRNLMDGDPAWPATHELTAEQLDTVQTKAANFARGCS